MAIGPGRSNPFDEERLKNVKTNWKVIAIGIGSMIAFFLWLVL